MTVNLENMRVIVVADATELAQEAADQIASQLRAKPDLSLLAPTGNTPMGAYAELARRKSAGTLETQREHR